MLLICFLLSTKSLDKLGWVPMVTCYNRNRKLIKIRMLSMEFKASQSGVKSQWVWMTLSSSKPWLPSQTRDDWPLLLCNLYIVPSVYKPISVFNCKLLKVRDPSLAITNILKKNLRLREVKAIFYAISHPLAIKHETEAQGVLAHLFQELWVKIQA